MSGGLVGLQVAILMQGSDFINVSVVPSFSVNQFDLGDMYLSPCRAEMYSSDHSGVCKECDTCVGEQYVAAECLPYQNRRCVNCTVCKRTERPICDCNVKTQQCYVGDRICTPLLPTTVNLTFDVSTSVPLTALQRQFLDSGMRNVFVTYLANFMSTSESSVTFLGMALQGNLTFHMTYIISGLYSQDLLGLVNSFDSAQVQAGLAFTFGGAGSSTARRRALGSNSVGDLLAGGVYTSCVSLTSCPQFFSLLAGDTPCNNLCVPAPCPAGYVGDFGLCVPCPNATFKEAAGNGTCIACPDGISSNMASTSLLDCVVPIMPALTGTIGVLGVPDSSGGVVTSQIALVQGSSPPPLATMTTTRSGLPVTTTGQAAPTSTALASSTGKGVSTSASPASPSSARPFATSAGTGAGTGTGVMGTIRHYRETIIINQDDVEGQWALVMAMFIMMCGFLGMAGIGAVMFYLSIQRGSVYTPLHALAGSASSRVIRLALTRPVEPL